MSAVAGSVPSQAVQAKAARYLLEGRVRVLDAHGRWLRAEVRGRAGVYEVVFDAPNAPRWSCSCAARSTCAHVVACQAVWAPAPPERAARLVAARAGV